MNLRTTINWSKPDELPSPDTDLEQRLPVWRACSEFFLDNELQPEDIEKITQALSESPYSIGSLEWIMFEEVSPALGANFFIEAGEWSGWTDEDLKSHILDAYKPERQLAGLMRPLKEKLWPDWPDVVDRIRGLRGQAI